MMLLLRKNMKSTISRPNLHLCLHYLRGVQEGAVVHRSGRLAPLACVIGIEHSQIVNNARRARRRFYSERGYASASADAKGASAIKGGNDDPSVEGNEKVEEEQLRIPLYMEGTEGSHGHKITEWLVKEGDAFESDEPICQVETEEFFYEILADHVDGGILAEIHVQPGTPVADGDLLATLVSNEEKYSEFLQESAKRSPESTGKSDLAFLFADLKLPEELLHVLEEDGFDTIEGASTLVDEDLEAMGMKKGHRRLLLKRIAETLKV